MEIVNDNILKVCEDIGNFQIVVVLFIFVKLNSEKIELLSMYMKCQYKVYSIYFFISMIKS